MPSIQEYAAGFNDVAEAVMNVPINSKREARHIAALANQACTVKHREYVADISRRWKEGFSALKSENDQMQKDLREAYRGSPGRTQDWLDDVLEGLQK